jgi:hypothetical protein
MPISGFAAGSFINVTASASLYTKVVGADGEVSRSKSANYTHEITITLMQSSLSNQYLSSIETMDKLTGQGVLPFSMTDLNGGTLKFWPQVWIEKDPDLGYNAEQTDRVWTFHTGQIAASNIGATLT